MLTTEPRVQTEGWGVIRNAEPSTKLVEPQCLPVLVEPIDRSTPHREYRFFRTATNMWRDDDI